MSWTPTIVVTVNGEPLAHDVVADHLTITRGRDGVDEQARAGYALVELVDRGGTLARIPIDAQLTITVDGHPLVTDADVSDVALNLDAAGRQGVVVVHTVRALGKLARLHRGGPVPTPLPEQLDGERIATILDGRLSTRWSNAHTWWPLAGTWSDVPADLTWSDATSTPAAIDAGLYLLAAVPEGEQLVALPAAQHAALDGLGQLDELADGSLRYTDAEGRSARIAANGWTELPADAVLAGLSAGVHVGEIANRIVVDHPDPTDPDAMLSAIANDLDDQAARGVVREHHVTTSLAEPDDAQARADRLLRLRVREAATIDQLVVLVDQVDDELRDRLLELEVGDPVRLVGLPRSMGRRFAGFVESLTWTVTRSTAQLALTVSDLALSEFALRWSMLDPEHPTWSDVPADVTWNRAQEITA